MDQSPLHRIGNKAFPAEVRNKIFKLAVTFDSPLSLASLADASGITRVCRQTRSETRLLFYASNSFEYASPIKLSWPLMAGRFQMGKLRKNPPRDAHSKQLCGLLKITLGYDTLKLIRRISISGVGDDNERAELTIFIGADAVAEHVQLPMWIKTQKGLTEDDPSSLTGFLAPRDPFFKNVLEAFDELGFEMFALEENKRFNGVLGGKSEFGLAYDHHIQNEHETKFGRHYEFCAV